MKSFPIRFATRLNIALSGFQHALVALRFRAGVRHMVALAIEADDEHGTAMEIAPRLVRRDTWGLISLRRDVADPLPEATSAKLVGAAEEVDGVVGVIRSDTGFHGPEMFVT